MADNPYEPENSFPRVADKDGVPLVSLRTIGFVLGVGVVGGVFGLGLGVGIAYLAPEYYGQLFNPNGHPGFSPVRLGIALGTSQGFGAGCFVGVVLAVAERWISRRHETSSIPAP